MAAGGPRKERRKASPPSPASVLCVLVSSHCASSLAQCAMVMLSALSTDDRVTGKRQQFALRVLVKEVCRFPSSSLPLLAWADAPLLPPLQAVVFFAALLVFLLFLPTATSFDSAALGNLRLSLYSKLQTDYVEMVRAGVWVCLRYALAC